MSSGNEVCGTQKAIINEINGILDKLSTKAKTRWENRPAELKMVLSLVAFAKAVNQAIEDKSKE